MTDTSSPDIAVALADRIDATKRGWIPIAGHVVNVTFNLAEADMISAALRARSSAGIAKPLTHRWRSFGAHTWIYDPEPEWLEDHKFEVEWEPVYGVPQPPALAQAVPPSLLDALASCKGEHSKFEAWAAAQKYDMSEHPIHYLFTDPKTYAARQGWKAALEYVASTIPSTQSNTPRCEHGNPVGVCTICHMWSEVSRPPLYTPSAEEK